MFRLKREPLIIHTLSVCCANDTFDVTELVTDTVGLEIADRLGWRYTSYTNALDHLVGEDRNFMWALGKLRTIELMNEPFCHLDNDFILDRHLSLRLRQARIFVQSKDVPAYYYGEDMDRAKAIAGFAPYAVPYNVGIIGGSDIPALHKYAKEAIEASIKFAGRGGEINGTTVSMMLEQYFLGAFSRRERIRVEELIPLHWTDDDIKEVMACHCVGGSKYSAKWAGLAEKRLMERYPDAYRRFLKGWELLSKDGN